MIKRIVLAAALTALLGSAAQSAQAACAERPYGPRYDARVGGESNVRTKGVAPGGGAADITTTSRTSVRVCDHRRGRERTMRRGRFVSELHLAELAYANGRSISSVTAAGRNVAWLEMTGTGAALDRMTLRLRVATLPSGRIIREKTLRRGPTSFAAYEVSLALNRWQDLFWLNTDGAWRWRAGRQPVRVADKMTGTGPIEQFDGGRTVWAPGIGFLDLRGLPIRDGCPRRDGFHKIVSTDDLVVTKGTLPGHHVVWRACWRRAHRDVVVFDGNPVGSDGSVFGRARVVGLAGRWLLVGTEVGSGKYAVSYGSLRRVDVARGFVASLGDAHQNAQTLWHDNLGAVLLSDGAVAWVGQDATTYSKYTVQLTRADGNQTELDSASSGLSPNPPLTALAANGRTLTWLHDGQPRSYVVP
jgi:hypothetical protein